MKHSPLWRVLVWTGVMVFLIAILMMGVQGFSFADIGSLGFSSYTYDHSDEYSAGASSVDGDRIRELDIDWVSGRVDIEVYAGSTIQFSETASQSLDDSQVLYYLVKGDKLSIKFTRSGRGLSLRSIPEKQLTVRIPASIALKRLDIENVSSAVALSGGGIHVQQLDVENVSGEVVIENISAKELTLETVNGAVSIDGTFDTIDAEGVNGSHTYRLGYPIRALDVETVNGKITLLLPERQGFVAQLESVSGSIQSDYADVSGRRVASYGDGSAKLDLETVNGGVEIRHDASLDVIKQAQPAAAAAAPTPQPTGSESIPSSERKY